MPEFISEGIGEFRRVLVHFDALESVTDFEKRLGVTLPKKAKFMWFPEKERAVFRDDEYVDG